MSEQLNAAEGRLGRVVVVRLAPGTDLLKGIQEACERYQIHNGVVISAIGSLKCVRFCDVEALPEKKCGYGYGRILTLDETIELTGAGGVICSDAENNINLHIHIRKWYANRINTIFTLWIQNTRTCTFGQTITTSKFTLSSMRF